MRNLLKVWKEVWKSLEKLFRGFLFGLIAIYRTLGTTHLGGSCRFEPSCSAYALEAVKTHKSHKAFWLISKRICKCRPGGPFGYDPVPSLGGDTHAAK